MKKNNNNIKKASYGALVAGCLLLAACGGEEEQAQSSAETISGSVFASSVSGATCEVLDGGGAVLGTAAVTAADGTFQVSVPGGTLQNEFSVNCSGGTFRDEATGTSGVQAGTLSALATTDHPASGGKLHITPATTMLHEMVQSHGLTMAQARVMFQGAFGYLPDLSVAPVDAVAGSPMASEEQLRAGLRAAAISQLALELSLSASEQFALVQALAADLSDGTLDGTSAQGAVALPGGGSLPADIQSRYVTALLNFHANDATGLTPDRLGELPLAPLATSASYQVRYIPSAMGALEGHSTFTIQVSDQAGDPVVDDIIVTPVMNMAQHSHGAPVEGCINRLDGTHDCTVYYLMASVMNGMSMGYWKLSVSVGGESVSFFPQVLMPMMGGNAKAVLKGQSDEISMMAGLEKRSYYIFKSSLSGTAGDYQADLFIAAKETMMSFPAVYPGVTLTGGTMPLEVTSMEVLVSADGGVSWVSATDAGNGHWSAGGLALASHTEGMFNVQVIVNGELKTTDGNAPGAMNQNAIFNLGSGGGEECCE